MAIDFIVDDYLIVDYSRNPHGKCLVCTKRIVELLIQRNIPYRVIGLLRWSGLSDKTPANHYAVVVSINGQAIIIDPTAGQFSGWKPFYGSIDDWIEGFKRYLSPRLIKGREFITISEAEATLGSLIIGSPVDFNGIVLQNTEWHDRIIKNPVLFATQEQKQIQASAFVPLCDLKSRTRWNCFKK
ncbi:hypothetical protein [Xenorhabdus koppenhoeferi]|uniref:hypothetical protein n=1 Tax=Xenorhabdus koppenhoeferi TaxID=351659 RepID=UPI0015A57D00|nr:hypothetical protein [Xenorhabdus koppenhoeferi]